MDTPIKLGDKAADGSQLRPYIVWFGEFVTEYQTAAEIIKDADIFVVIGTSFTVTPASELIEHIRQSASLGVESFVDRLLELQY